MKLSRYLLKITFLTFILHIGWCIDVLSPEEIPELSTWEERVKRDSPFLIPDNVAPQEIEDFINSGANDPDKYLNTKQLIEKAGYKVEEYYVITEDKYNLTMFRIPFNGAPGQSCSANISTVQTPVLLGHGFFCSSDDWVTPGIKNGIAFLLSNACYDVWAINYRGNKYSRRHVFLSPDHDASYWDFTFHQMGKYDMAATIDYILNNTGHTSLKYVCHSQGCTDFFVMGSERPEYAKKVTVTVGLSVLAWMSHTISPALWLFAIGKPLFHAAESLGFHEFADDNPINNYLREVICGTRLKSNVICSTIIFLIGGFDYSQINATTFNVQMAHVPAGVSLANAEHLGQLVKSAAFRQYDYGLIGNLKNYKSPSPPDYNLANIETAVAILAGDGDWLAREEDLNILMDHLPNVIEYYKVPYKGFNHFNFIWAKDLYTLLFPKILELLNKY